VVHPHQVVVVGAGISGLACARALADAGQSPIVLERARGVGGRCATRRVQGQPVDLGPAFLHGQAPDFLAALEGVPGTRLPGWPKEIHGAGRPCQPEAFAPGESRLAFAEGLTVFPKWLARGLAVRTEIPVLGLEVAGHHLEVRVEKEDPLTADTVVLAVAAEQALRLLDERVEGEVATLRAMLSMSESEPALALAALYPAETPAPGWQVNYPQGSRILQMISLDSDKRVEPRFCALVFQTHPRWSAEHVNDAAWPDLVLAEAGRIVGAWAATPLHRHAHRWSFARTSRSGELAAPMFFQLPGGARLGICGDRFGPGGGVEAAWLSGRALARRILAEETA
jgi:renalase